jgi:hypothetical protein
MTDNVIALVMMTEYYDPRPERLASRLDLRGEFHVRHDHEIFDRPYCF